MPDPKLLFVLDAKNLASKEMEKVRKDLGGINASAKTAGGGIGSYATALGGSKLVALGVAGAIGGVILGLKGAAEAAIAEEKNIARLDAALKANVTGWDGNTTAIDKRIAAGEKLAFSDDEQRASLAMLVGATKDVTKAHTLQATAMDLARFKGISLEAASAALIKVEGGQYRALKQLGIVLPATATATEALAAVQKVAAGQAQTYADTTGGTFESLGIAMENIQEDVGAMLLPILKELAVFARDQLIPAFRDFIEFIGPLAGIIGDAFGVIGEAIDFLTTDTEEMLRDRIPAAALAASDAMIELAKTPDAMAADMRESGRIAAVSAAASAVLYEPIVGAQEEAQKEAKIIARATPFEIAKSLRDGSDPVKVAGELLKDALKNSLTPMKEIAALEGELSGKALQDALNDKRPEVRAAAQAWKAAAEERLFALRNDVPEIALGTGVDYATALTSARAQVGASARGLASAARTPLEGINAYQWGRDGGMDFADGMDSATRAVRNAAYNLATTAAKYLQFGSPTEEGPFSEKGGPEGWARIGVEGFLRPWREGVGDLAGILGGYGSMPMMSNAGGFGGGGGGSSIGMPSSVGQPFEIHSHLYLDGREIYENVEEHRYYANAASPR